MFGSEKTGADATGSLGYCSWASGQGVRGFFGLERAGHDSPPSSPANARWRIRAFWGHFREIVGEFKRKVWLLFGSAVSGVVAGEWVAGFFEKSGFCGVETGVLAGGDGGVP